MQTFSVATNEYRGGNGERTEYHACVAWDWLAEICGQFLSKGQLVDVEGPQSSHSHDRASWMRSKEWYVKALARHCRARAGRAIFGISLAALSAGCLNAGPGACTAEAAAAFHQIEHYGGISLEPQDYPLGGRCVASFTSEDEPRAVLDFYRAQWTTAGWTLDSSPPLPSASPDAGEPDAVLGGASAHKDGMTYSVTVFREEETRYELLVGADQ